VKFFEALARFFGRLAKFYEARAKFPETLAKFRQATKKFRETVAKFRETTKKFREALAKFCEATDEFHDGLAPFLEATAKFHETLTKSCQALPKFRARLTKSCEASAKFRAATTRLPATTKKFHGVLEELREALSELPDSVIEIGAAFSLRNPVIAPRVARRGMRREGGSVTSELPAKLEDDRGPPVHALAGPSGLRRSPRDDREKLLPPRGARDGESPSPTATRPANAHAPAPPSALERNRTAERPHLASRPHPKQRRHEPPGEELHDGPPRDSPPHPVPQVEPDLQARDHADEGKDEKPQRMHERRAVQVTGERQPGGSSQTARRARYVEQHTHRAKRREARNCDEEHRREDEKERLPCPAKDRGVGRADGESEHSRSRSGAVRPGLTKPC
jgi:hypothetical protein